jgi:hypothetical protein
VGSAGGWRYIRRYLLLLVVVVRHCHIGHVTYHM